MICVTRLATDAIPLISPTVLFGQIILSEVLIEYKTTHFGYFSCLSFSSWNDQTWKPREIIY